MSYKIEMHCHTRGGSNDSEISPKELIKQLKASGFKGAIITNHYDDYQIRYQLCKKFKASRTYACNNCKTKHSCQDEQLALFTWVTDISEAQRYGEEAGIKIYTGMEYTLSEGEHISIIGCSFEIFIEDYLQPERDLDYLRVWANRHNCLLIENHPCRYKSTPLIDQKIDGYEIFNSKQPATNDELYNLSLWSNEMSKKIQIAGGDCHAVIDCGYAGIEVKFLPHNEQELVKVLKAGEFQIYRKRK